MLSVTCHMLGDSHLSLRDHEKCCEYWFGICWIFFFYNEKTTKEKKEKAFGSLVFIYIYTFILLLTASASSELWATLTRRRWATKCFVAVRGEEWWDEVWKWFKQTTWKLGITGFYASCKNKMLLWNHLISWFPPVYFSFQLMRALALICSYISNSLFCWSSPSLVTIFDH